jgi:hypothetical protein
MRLAALLLAAGLSTAGLATTAFAQPAPPAPPPAAQQVAPPPAPSAKPHGIRGKFEAANTTHDGKLTLAQAEAAGLRKVVKHFADIDRDNKGYVTMQDLKAWHQERKAEKAAAHGQAPAGAPPPGAPPQGAPPPAGPQY